MNLEGVHPDCFLKRINEISSDVCKPRLITCYHLKKKKKTKKHPRNCHQRANILEESDRERERDLIFRNFVCWWLNTVMTKQENI